MQSSRLSTVELPPHFRTAFERSIRHKTYNLQKAKNFIRLKWIVKNAKKQSKKDMVREKTDFLPQLLETIFDFT